MISVKCPHCQIGLKVNEGKLPLGITSFKCPNCKQAIPVSYLKEERKLEQEPETVLLHSSSAKGIAKLTVLSDNHTPQQSFPLEEGVYIVGRKSASSLATIQIETDDRFMSRSHIRIEVVKDAKGDGYNYYLSDNNSKNQTLYNNSYLNKDEVVVLSDGDEIVIGRTVLLFNV